jgi:hypothetical protein
LFCGTQGFQLSQLGGVDAVYAVILNHRVEFVERDHESGSIAHRPFQFARERKDVSHLSYSPSRLDGRLGTGA